MCVHIQNAGLVTPTAWQTYNRLSLRPSDDAYSFFTENKVP